MARRTLLVLALLVGLLAGCASDDRYQPLPVPEASEEPAAPTTTTPTNLDEVGLAAAPGVTTTTAPVVGPGPATIVGRVDGPDGPVAGAIVRLERVVGDKVATLEVPTAADGTWNATKVLGGSYRVRAYLAPTFGMVRAEVRFIEALRPAPIILRLERFDGVRVDGVMAPNPPLVGETANLKVRVTLRQVDNRGIVRNLPQVGLSVTLTGNGNWGVLNGNPGVTGGDGSVVFNMVCGSEGSQPLAAFLPSGESYDLKLPACARRPPPTTSTTSTTQPDDDDDAVDADAAG